MAEWSDKVVLMTGGSGGIARPTARLFLEQGAVVFLSDIDKKGLEKAAAELDPYQDRVKTLAADVSKVDDCRRIVADAVRQAGRLDVLVNTAGIWIEGPAVQMSEAQYDRIMAVNLKGTFFCCTSAMPALTKTEGCIVNISSDAGLFASSTGRASLYSISKAGVVMLTKVLAIEGAPFKVRVNAVCPGDVDTPMLAGQARDYGGEDPQGYLRRFLDGLPQKEHARFVRAEEVAQCIFFLASPSVAAITGTCLSVDFGSTAHL